MPLLFEFKARSNENSRLEELVKTGGGKLAGEDLQTDTYFNVPQVRLKLREGRIENALIQYNRADVAGAKTSEVLLYQHQPDGQLKEVLSKALGVKAVVEKKRRIWFVDNVKIHFDTVEGLGTFVEVEAIDRDGSIGLERLKEQCFSFACSFGIKEEDYIAQSYSDLLLADKDKIIQQ